jgi:hypothetical protein
MLNQLLAASKSVLRPVVRQLALVERAKYLGTHILSAEQGNDWLAGRVADRTPIAVGKMGESELGGLRHFERFKNAAGLCTHWGRYARRLNVNAGVYPANDAVFSKFCQVFGRSLGDLDMLAVWFRAGENNLRLKFASRAIPTQLRALEPFYHERPWSHSLLNKKVLVVTPFASTVQSQHSSLGKIWASRPGLMPSFDLQTLRCPLSAGIANPVFPDWFVALDEMKNEMSRRKFDVALIGAGAWGIPLASHAKSIGSAAIHLGGPTQLLFGIRGGRWDNNPIISQFFNAAWVRPGEADRPERFRNIENGCDW